MMYIVWRVKLFWREEVEMIEITKPGKKSEKEKRAILTFTCPKCGCEFLTDEYSKCAERCPTGRRWIEVKCPEKDCGNTFSVEDKQAKAVLG